MNIFILLKTLMITDWTYDDHDLVADIDSDTLIRIVTFLKGGKAPGPDNIHNEVLKLGTTTSLFHHLARLFTSSIPSRLHPNCM